MIVYPYTPYTPNSILSTSILSVLPTENAFCFFAVHFNELIELGKCMPIHVAIELSRIYYNCMHSRENRTKGNCILVPRAFSLPRPLLAGEKALGMQNEDVVIALVYRNFKNRATFILQ